MKTIKPLNLTLVKRLRLKITGMKWFISYGSGIKSDSITVFCLCLANQGLKLALPSLKPGRAARNTKNKDPRQKTETSCLWAVKASRIKCLLNSPREENQTLTSDDVSHRAKSKINSWGSWLRSASAFSHVTRRALSIG